MAEIEPHVLRRLLAEADWLPRMARGLVSEPGLADDVSQQTWLAALRSPPAHGESPRGWLATVARRVVGRMARGERRRASREARAAARAAAAGSPPDPAALAAQVEMQRRVAEAVLSLDEPYRATVVMRYFEDLSPAEIAAALAIPAATVRTRLHRGLSRLRRRLDDAHDGRRDAWIPLLLPLARRATDSPATATIASGGLLMGWMTWIGVAAIAAAGAIAFFGFPGAGPAPAPAFPPPVEAGGPPPAAVAGAPEEDDGEQDRAPVPLRGRVSDPGGEPLRNAYVYVVVDGEMATARFRTEADGRFLVVVPAGAGEVDLVVDAAGFVPLVRPIEAIPEPGEGELELSVEPGLSLSGTVRDETGAPVKTTVQARRMGAPKAPFNVYSRHFPMRRQALGFSDEEGRFVIGGLSPERHILEKSTRNHLAGEGSVVECDAGAKGIVLVVYRAVCLTLRFQDAATGEPFGEGVAYKLARADGEEWSGRNAGGDAVLRGMPGGKYRLSVRAPGAKLWEGAVELDLDESSKTVPVTLERTGHPGYGGIRGAIDRAGAEGAAGAKFFVFSPEVGIHEPAFAGDDGSFEFPKLPAGTYHLRAMSRDGAWASRHATVEVTADDRAEVRLRIGPAGQVLLRVIGYDECEERRIEIRLFDGDGLLVGDFRTARGDDGDFRFPAEGLTLSYVVAGPVRAIAVARGRILADAHATVVAGRPTFVDLALAATAEGAPPAPESARAVPAPAALPPRPKAPAPPPPPPLDEGAPTEIVELAARLVDPDQGVRFAATVELGKLGDARAVPVLVHVLEHDPDGFVRRAAIRSLSDLGRASLSAVPAIAAALFDDNPFVRLLASQAIAEIAGQALPYRKGMTKEEVARAAKKLVEEVEHR